MYQERENEKRPGKAHTLNKLKGVWHASDVTPQKLKDFCSLNEKSPKRHGIEFKRLKSGKSLTEFFLKELVSKSLNFFLSIPRLKIKKGIRWNEILSDWFERLLFSYGTDCLISPKSRFFEILNIRHLFCYKTFRLIWIFAQMAWLGFLFFLYNVWEVLDHANLSCLVPSKHLRPERKKPFGWSWDWTHALSLCKWLLYLLHHGSLAA